MTLTTPRVPGSIVCSVHIDLSAIRDNTAVMVRRVAPRIVVADVSADGYGHGAVAVARAVLGGGANEFSVSRLEDARELQPIDGLIGVTAVSDRSRSARGSEWTSSGGCPRGEAYRAGSELYGLTDDPELRPAMSVRALVVGTKTIEAGEGVSYGYTYRAPSRTNLALVGIGYADGLDRAASNLGSLLLGGVERRIVGRVAMNALVLDLGTGTVSVGDEAVVFGDPRRGEPTASAWASLLGKSAAEVATVFGTHLPRVNS